MLHNKFGILSARCLFRGITVNMDIKGVELSGSRLQGCSDQIIRDIGKCQVLKLHRQAEPVRREKSLPA